MESSETDAIFSNLVPVVGDVAAAGSAVAGIGDVARIEVSLEELFKDAIVFC